MLLFENFIIGYLNIAILNNQTYLIIILKITIFKFC